MTADQLPRDAPAVNRWEIDVPLVVRARNGDWRPFTANDRPHWRKRADWTAEIRRDVYLSARALRIPPQQHIIVGLHYAPGDNRRRDAPNLTTTQKPAVDGLVDAGIVPDDTAAYVTELMPVIVPGTRAPSWPRRLWLVVQARPADTPRAAS